MDVRQVRRTISSKDFVKPLPEELIVKHRPKYSLSRYLSIAKVNFGRKNETGLPVPLSSKPSTVPARACP